MTTRCVSLSIHPTFTRPSPPSAPLLAVPPPLTPPPKQIRPRVNKSHTAIETVGVKHSLNPFDEISLEAAVRLREAKSGPKVTDILAISAGPAKCVDVLRTAMAMGADRSIHVEVEPKDGEGELEPLGVAKLLQKVVEKEGSNFVILGKQSIDDDSNQTGQMLAGLLNWPQATCASKIEFEEGSDNVNVIREVDGGVETLRGKVPMVVTTDLRLNEPRYASLPNIMKAKKKEMKKGKLEDWGVEGRRRLKTLKVEGKWSFLISVLGGVERVWDRKTAYIHQ